jgi:hypothetical protein
MPVVYLEPGDLSASQEARVLAFLNQVSSAAELAESIEFPNELDIGIRLAQRLLDARSLAGGAFSSLSQVAAVPYIGPERFTEICAAALGLAPDYWSRHPELFGGSQLSSRELNRLQAQLLDLLRDREQVVLELKCLNQPAWLGQALDLRLSARDAAGRPLANRRITLQASLGRLEAAYGLAIQSGPVLELRTGTDGSVRLGLYYTPRETLSAEQQAALEEVLGRLDPLADSPHLLQDAFFQIAAAYQQERRSSLREALDIYANEGKQRFFDQLNASNLGFYWPLEVSTLRAAYHPDPVQAGVSAQAVLAVRWKNWVGAWFEYLGAYLSGRAGLQQAFAAAKQRGAEGFRLVDDLLGEAHSFVAGQPGLAAQWLSQRVVKYAVHDFLALETADLDANTQRELFSHLEIASDQLKATDRGALSAVNETRIDMDNKLQDIGVINSDLLDQMLAVQQAVDLQAAQVTEQADLVAEQAILIAEQAAQVAEAEQSVLTAQSAIDAKIAGFDASYLVASQEITQVQTELVEFRTESTQITRALDSVQTEMDKVKLDIIDIKTRG